MDFVDCDVTTLCTGLAASMGAVILSHGTKGKRKSLKRSRVMIHQPLGDTGYSQASDIEITAKEILKIKKELAELLADNTGQTVKKIMKDGDRDYWMDSKEAEEYGIIDGIIQKKN
jgi:ATP-dependent Clp protease protease subunit